MSDSIDIDELSNRDLETSNRLLRERLDVANERIAELERERDAARVNLEEAHDLLGAAGIRADTTPGRVRLIITERDELRVQVAELWGKWDAPAIHRVLDALDGDEK